MAEVMGAQSVSPGQNDERKHGELSAAAWMDDGGVRRVWSFLLSLAPSIFNMHDLVLPVPVSDLIRLQFQFRF